MKTAKQNSLTRILFAVVFAVMLGFAAPLALAAAQTEESVISASDGKALTATDFAKLMALYIKKDEIKNATFLFQECFGGGMLPSLQSTFGDTITWIGGSASKANEPSHGLKDPTKKPNFWTNSLYIELQKKTQALGDSLQKASDNDIVGPKGIKETLNKSSK